MNTQNNRQQIRSIGLSRVNRITVAAAHLDDLLPAFEQWCQGEIYICRKTGDYRFRFGERSKSITPWSKLAKSLFQSIAEFAFAAMVFAPEAAQEGEGSGEATTSPAPAGTRVNVLEMAAERRAA